MASVRFQIFLIRSTLQPGGMGTEFLSGPRYRLIGPGSPMYPFREFYYDETEAEEAAANYTPYGDSYFIAKRRA
jgi:hypothetical protein